MPDNSHLHLQQGRPAFTTSSANTPVAHPYSQHHPTSIIAQNHHPQGQLSIARIPTGNGTSYSQGQWLGTSQPMTAQRPNFEQRHSMPGSASANSQQTQHPTIPNIVTVNTSAHSQYPATGRSNSASTNRPSPIAPQAGCFRGNVVGPYRTHGITHQSSQISSGGAVSHPPYLPLGGHQSVRSSENNLQSRNPPTQEPRRDVLEQAQSAPRVHASPLDRTQYVPSTPLYQPQNQSDGVRRQSTSTLPPPSSLQGADTVSPSNTYPAHFTEQAAIHASRILARARPLLLEYLSHEQKHVQDELLRLNSVYESQLINIKGELHRAFQSEREVLERQEASRQERKSFLEKAMQLKESLEEYKRENKLLKERNIKVAQIALRLHKDSDVSSDRSAVTIADLRDRITFLEQRLKKYEEVPSTTIEESASESPSHIEVTENESQRSEADKRRLQKQTNIVAKLVERNSKPGSPKPSVEVIKEELSSEDGKKNLIDRSFVIDLTADDSVPEGVSVISLASAPPADSHFNTANSETLQYLGSSDSSNSVSFELPVGDNLKRNSESEGNTDRASKRPRSDSTSLSPVSPEVASTSSSQHVEETLNDQKDLGQGEAGPASSMASGLGENPDSDGISSDPGASERDLAREHVDSMPQLEFAHLQLIYHKDKSGAKECRLCLIEMDIGVRDPDSATVFLPGVSDDELIAHSVSSHRGAVYSLLQLEKAALLSTFEEMMEAA